MSGEGTGGGGAVVALLVLWLVAGVLLLTEGPVNLLGQDDAAGDASEAQVVTGPSAAEDETIALTCEELGNCDEPVTRAEFAAMLAETLELPPAEDDYYTDDDGSQHEDAINRVTAAGLLGNCRDADDAYCPDRSMARAGVARILVRSFEVPPADETFFVDIEGHRQEEAINALAAAGIAEACAYERYCPAAPATGREVTSMLERAVAPVEPESSPASASS